MPARCSVACAEGRRLNGQLVSAVDPCASRPSALNPPPVKTQNCSFRLHGFSIVQGQRGQTEEDRQRRTDRGGQTEEGGQRRTDRGGQTEEGGQRRTDRGEQTEEDRQSGQTEEDGQRDPF